MEAAKKISQQVEPMEMTCPWTESPFFYSWLEQKNLSPDKAKLATDYYEKGYIILENVFSDELIDRILNETKPLYQPDVKDGPRSYYRVQDAWQECPSVREMAGHQKIIDALEFLYERKPFPFQTLNFLHGSQQGAHSDAVHFSSLPSRYMCGAWVALEDVDDTNGPLFYYPGSNRLPEFNAMDVVKQPTFASADYPQYEKFIQTTMELNNIKREAPHIKKGSALIWSSNLVHGGSPILKEGSTRLSQVTHYYFEDCIYYTPIFSNTVSGELTLKDVVDVRTGETVPHGYNGWPVYVYPCIGHRKMVCFGNEAHAMKKKGILLNTAQRKFAQLKGKIVSKIDNSDSPLLSKMLAAARKLKHRK